MPDLAVAAMLSAIEAIEELRSVVGSWKAEIQTVARVVNIFPDQKREEPPDAE